MRMSTHPDNTHRIIFDPNKHTYTGESGLVYTSVTTLISYCFPSFNTDEVAATCAQKRGVSKQSLIDEWKTIGDRAAENGSKVHAYLESKLLKLNTNPPIDKYYKPSADKIINHIHSKNFKVIAVEKILFSPSLKLAGTVDLILYDSIINRYIVLDWKTSKQIDLTNKYHERGLNELKHLDNCSLVHYSLQLLLYGLLLVNEGYLDKTIPIEYKIVNIHPQGSFKKTRSYEILDLKNEAMILREKLQICQSQG